MQNVNLYQNFYDNNDYNSSDSSTVYEEEILFSQAESTELTDSQELFNEIFKNHITTGNDVQEQSQPNKKRKLSDLSSNNSNAQEPSVINQEFSVINIDTLNTENADFFTSNNQPIYNNQPKKKRKIYSNEGERKEARRVQDKEAHARKRARDKVAYEECQRAFQQIATVYDLQSQATKLIMSIQPLRFQYENTPTLKPKIQLIERIWRKISDIQPFSKVEKTSKLTYLTMFTYEPDPSIDFDKIEADLKKDISTLKQTIQDINRFLLQKT